MSPAAPPDPPAPSDRARYWWALPTVVTLLLIPVTGFLGLMYIFVPSSCTEESGCRATWQQSGGLILLSVGVALVSWAWPHTRRGNLWRWLTLAAYVVAVAASVYMLRRLPQLESD
ncbi:hypothetical protein [Embleya sp. NBC_00896]|uniref:hypothetical protein n=1 Tax=Embleya sp. NBC_00896 TaxID=2975961 RepID=UPI003869A87C|nr:hypothetical protein OG928_26045 [Embleya sp. NBC_00896]